jgi:selenium metabolism protein YedF
VAHELDMRGESCPTPVIETRKALISGTGRSLEVIVDNEAACENVSRLAQSLNAEAQVINRDNGNIRIHINPGDVVNNSSLPDSSGGNAADNQCGTIPRNVVLLNSASIGPDEELGHILMKAFIKTLLDIPPLPEVVILLNSGVKLTCDNSELIEVFAALEQAGSIVLSCGTCLEYYDLTDKLAVGKVTNMFDVVSLLSGADRIIKP